MHHARGALGAISLTGHPPLTVLSFCLLLPRFPCPFGSRFVGEIQALSVVVAITMGHAAGAIVSTDWKNFLAQLRWFALIGAICY